MLKTPALETISVANLHRSYQLSCFTKISRNYTVSVETYALIYMYGI